MLTKPTALNWSESNSASLHQTQGVSAGIPVIRRRRLRKAGAGEAILEIGHLGGGDRDGEGAEGERRVIHISKVRGIWLDSFLMDA
ncbi:hypothetical protein GCM10010213_30710 [Microbacterium maritypicum]|nr:hypothetical protein GCM10010213_30710 [Microbacterium liquefaciens]